MIGDAVGSAKQLGFIAGQVVFLTVVAVAWELLSLVSFIVPDPVDTVGALFHNFTQPVFTDALRKTGLDSLVAFLLSALIGIVVGAIIGLSKTLGRILEPGVLALNGIPKITIYPILLLLFGLGSSSQIVMGFVFGVFPVIINFAGGLGDVPSIYRKLARSLDMSWHSELTKFSIPSALPSLAVGVRLAFSLSIVGVIFSEIIASKGGVGQVIISKVSLGQYDLVGAAVLLIICVSVIGTTALWTLERRMAQRWGDND